MEVYFLEENFEILFFYLDDIFVFLNIVDEYLCCLDIVFIKFKFYGLKMKLIKCSFFNILVKYFGYVVFEKGIFIDFEKIEVIKLWLILIIEKEFRLFFGLVGYYR